MKTQPSEFFDNGFTLLELVIALAIFSTLSVLAYGGLSGSVKASNLLRIDADRRATLQRAVRLIEQDFRYPVARPVRDQYGDPIPAVVGNRRRISLTRGGWANPSAAPRSNLQRVEYRWQRGTLRRLQWASLDRSPATQAIDRQLLDNLSDFSLSFYHRGRWLDVWPPQGLEQPPPLPEALRIELVHEQAGQIARVFALDSVEVP
ncbi:MAG: type II secretion system minor pseudopilin GspJ [Lysobacterales bacterium]